MNNSELLSVMLKIGISSMASLIDAGKIISHAGLFLSSVTIL